MDRSIYIRGLVPVAAVCVLALAGTARAEDEKPEGNGIVPPSEYVEDIETPGTAGGMMDEVDAGEAQAEAAEAAAKKAAEKKAAEKKAAEEKAAAKKKASEDAGGW